MAQELSLSMQTLGTTLQPAWESRGHSIWRDYRTKTTTRLRHF